MIVDIAQRIAARYGSAPSVYALDLLERKLTQYARRMNPSVLDPACVSVTRSWESMVDISVGASTRTRIDAVSPVKEGRWIR